MVSGLGGDERLFVPQQTLPWPILAVKWIEPRRRESLASYGQRLAERLEVARPFFLGGVSIGGMLALEMSRWTRPEAVFLIASARSGHALRPIYRPLGWAIGTAPLWASLPPHLSRPLARLIAKHLLPSSRQLNAEQRRFLAVIASNASPRFVRWGCRAVVTWPGVDLPRVPVYHIHGERDRVIPLRRVRPDHIVRTGGHLINLSHAGEVNAYLKSKIEKHLAGK